MSRVKWSNPGKEVAPSPTPMVAKFTTYIYSKNVNFNALLRTFLD